MYLNFKKLKNEKNRFEKLSEKKQDDPKFLDGEFFNKMVYHLVSDDVEEIKEGLFFFNNYVRLAKDHQLVEYFLKYSGSLGQIITLFLENEYPEVTELSLELLNNIILFVPISFNPNVLRRIATHCVYLFAHGIFSLAIVLLDFIGTLALQSEVFCQTMFEEGALIEIYELEHCDQDDPLLLMNKTAMAFHNLLTFKIDLKYADDVAEIILLFFKWNTKKTTRYGILMLNRLLDFGVHISEYPFLIDPLSLVSVHHDGTTLKLLLRLIIRICSINKDFGVSVCQNNNFIANLSIQVLEKRTHEKGRSSILRFFRKISDYIFPKIDDLPIVAAMKGIASLNISFRQKKQIYKYFLKLCQDNSVITLQIGDSGILYALALNIQEEMNELNEYILNIAYLIGQAGIAHNIDIRTFNGYSFFAASLDQVLNRPNEPINYEKLQMLKAFYNNENSDE